MSRAAKRIERGAGIADSNILGSGVANHFADQNGSSKIARDKTHLNQAHFAVQYTVMGKYCPLFVCSCWPKVFHRDSQKAIRTSLTLEIKMAHIINGNLYAPLCRALKTLTR